MEAMSFDATLASSSSESKAAKVKELLDSLDTLYLKTNHLTGEQYYPPEVVPLIQQVLLCLFFESRVLSSIYYLLLFSSLLSFMINIYCSVFSFFSYCCYLVARTVLLFFKKSSHE